MGKLMLSTCRSFAVGFFMYVAKLCIALTWISLLLGYLCYSYLNMEFWHFSHRALFIAGLGAASAKLIQITKSWSGEFEGGPNVWRNLSQFFAHSLLLTQAYLGTPDWEFIGSRAPLAAMTLIMICLFYRYQIERVNIRRWLFLLGGIIFVAILAGLWSEKIGSRFLLGCTLFASFFTARGLYHQVQETKHKGIDNLSLLEPVSALGIGATAFIHLSYLWDVGLYLKFFTMSVFIVLCLPVIVWWFYESMKRWTLGRVIPRFSSWRTQKG